MRSELPEDEDRRLTVLFSQAAAPVADDGFSNAVQSRLARHVWHRRLLLGAAAVAGCSVAAAPAWRIAVMLGEQLTVLAARWPELGSLLQSPLSLAAGLMLLALPGLVRWLEE